jgi:uncharacterized damage-inducible protein DinB
MKELFVSYAGYNSWANGLVVSVIRDLPGPVQRQQVVSSFRSLHQTVLHLLDAESIWWQRLKLQEQVIRPSDGYTGDMTQLAIDLQRQDGQWLDWIKAVSENMLQHEFIYHNSKKEKFKEPVCQMLLHLFNHSTYHRGQLVTLLRQLGVEKIPATDYVLWTRKRAV